MDKKTRSDMVAICGTDCGICEMSICKDDPKLLAYFISKGYPKEKLPCPGCRAVKGLCPVLGEPCATYACAQEKKVEYCFQCAEFPCAKLNPAADRASTLPHNIKVFNLCTIKKLGVNGYIEVSADIKKKYYKGKMAVGRGPQLEA
jgi:hypothetical protein